MKTGGVGPFGANAIPNEELLKQLKLKTIKTRAGRVAYLMLLGEDAALGRVANGISKAEGSLKWISRVLEERTK
jgi:hypothetical protein